MFKLSVVIFSFFLNLSIESASISNAERKTSNLFLHLGLRDPRNALSIKSCNESTRNGHELSLLNYDLTPTATPQDVSRSKIVKRSGIPLVELGGQYYYFGTYFKANYFKAMQFCRDHGMDLISIESNEENMNIINHLGLYHKKIDHFWTSGTDLVEEGHFVWLSTGKAFNYTCWTHPQPDNAGKIENCMEIWKLGDQHYIWNDIPCTNTYHFICELRECTEFCL